MLGCFPSDDTPVCLPLCAASPYIDLQCIDGGTGVRLRVVECGVEGLSRSANSVRLTPSYPASTGCHDIMKGRGYRPGRLGVADECVDRDYVIT